MLARITAALSSCGTATISAAGFLSRVRFVVSGNGAAVAAAKLASDVLAGSSSLAHLLVPLAGRATSILFHITLGPANETLSFLTTTGRIAFAAIANAAHLAPLCLMH